jgi:hypothetical protein
MVKKPLKAWWKVFSVMEEVWLKGWWKSLLMQLWKHGMSIFIIGKCKRIIFSYHKKC